MKTLPVIAGSFVAYALSSVAQSSPTASPAQLAEGKKQYMMDAHSLAKFAQTNDLPLRTDACLLTFSVR